MSVFVCLSVSVCVCMFMHSCICACAKAKPPDLMSALGDLIPLIGARVPTVWCRCGLDLSVCVCWICEWVHGAYTVHAGVSIGLCLNANGCVLNVCLPCVHSVCVLLQ